MIQKVGSPTRPGRRPVENNACDHRVAEPVRPQPRGETAGRQLDVRTGKANIGAARHPKTGITRLAREGGTWQLDQGDFGEPLAYDLGGAVCPAHDHDNLERLRTALIHDGSYRARDAPLVVARD